MKKVLTKIFMIMIVFCMVISIISGCSSSSHDPKLVEQRVKDFVVKCNNLDIDGILRCIDPAVSEPIAIIVELMTITGKTDKYEIFSELTSVLINENGLDAMDFFESIDVEIVRTEIEGNYAYVYSNITYAIADIKFTKEGVIHLIEQADIWYVSWIEFGMFE